MNYQSVFENATEGIFQTTPDGQYMAANLALAHIYGYESIDDLKMSVTNIQRQLYVETNRRTEFKRLMDQYDAINDFESQIYRKNGSVIWIAETARAVRDPGGNLLHYEGFVSDITERKRVEEARARAEEKYRSIFENAIEGIFQTTPNGYYIDVNPALARIYGYDSAEDLIGSVTNIQRQLYVDVNRRPEFKRLMDEHDAIIDFESEIYRKDGSIIWISENARAVRDETGNLLYYEGSVMDITERKRAEAALIRQNAYLSALHETALSLMDRLRVEDLLEDIIARATRLYGTSHGFIYLLEPDEQRIRMKAAVGLFKAQLGSTLRSAEGLGGTVWRSGQPLIVENYSKWQGRVFNPAYSSLAATIGVPLKHRDRVIGVIGMSHVEADRQFSADEVDLLTHFAELASIALDNAQLFALLQHQQDQQRQQQQ